MGWSHAMRLCEYREFKFELLVPGVYEIGYVRTGFFHTKYIGKADDTIYERIKAHATGRGNKRVAEILQDSNTGFRRLYFHVMRGVGFNPAVREALMLIRHRYGVDSAYAWNNKYELQALRDNGYVVGD